MQAAQYAFCEREWLSCTNCCCSPVARKVPGIEAFIEKPRSSPNTFGSMIKTG
jgi:hypothetical protein